jgi:uncharacterized protein (DUF983 family)
MARYWYTICPVCKQGRLFIHVRDDTVELFLRCEECERAWNAPDQIHCGTGAFLAVDIDSHPADVDTLRERGWAGYAQHVA